MERGKTWRSRAGGWGWGGGWAGGGGGGAEGEREGRGAEVMEWRANIYATKAVYRVFASRLR